MWTRLAAFVFIATLIMQSAANRAVGQSSQPAFELIRTDKITSLDGPPPQRFVLIVFDSVEQAQAWHNSAAQTEVDAARIKSTDSLSFIVEGLAK